MSRSLPTSLHASTKIVSSIYHRISEYERILHHLHSRSQHVCEALFITHLLEPRSLVSLGNKFTSPLPLLENICRWCGANNYHSWLLAAGRVCKCLVRLSHLNIIIKLYFGGVCWRHFRQVHCPPPAAASIGGGRTHTANHTQLYTFPWRKLHTRYWGGGKSVPV